MSTDRRLTASALIFLAASTALTFDCLLRSDQLPYYRDLLHFVVPLKYLLGESLRSGTIPLWNPWIFLGTPFLASFQTGVLYPPSVLLILPFPLGFNLFAFAHYMIAAGGAWCLLRSRGLSHGSSAIGTLTFVLGGYLVSVLNLTSHLQAAAWLPWVLWCWQRFIASRSSLRFAAFSVTFAMEVLAGAPEILLMTLALTAAWTLFASAADRRNAVRLGFLLAAGVTLAAALTAIQVLPTAELITLSSRKDFLPYDEVSAWSLQPLSLLQLLIPHSSGLASEGGLNPILELDVPWLSSIYVGLIPLCLLSAGMAVGRERRFWGVAIVVSVVLALGDNTPVFRLLYDAVPQLFGKFRYPEKFWFVTHVATMMLVAEGAEGVLRGDPIARRAAVAAAGTLFAIALALLVLRWTDLGAFFQVLSILKGGQWQAGEMSPIAFDVVTKLSKLLVFLGAFLALSGLRSRRLVQPSVLSMALVALVAADLGAAHHNLNLRLIWSELETMPQLLDASRLAANHDLLLHYVVKKEKPGEAGATGFEPWVGSFSRVHLERDVAEYWGAEYPNAGMIQKVRELSGLEGIQPASDMLLRGVLKVLPPDQLIQFLRVYGVGYLVGRDALDWSGVELLKKSAGVWSPAYAYRVPEPAPLAYLVPRLEVAKSQLDAVNHLIRRGFSPRERAVVEELPDGWSDGTGTAGQAEVVAYGNDEVALRVEAAETSFLVLNEVFFPGWVCEIDGTPARILRTNALVRGTVVSAGEHAIRFRYSPRSFVIGAWISAATAATLAAWFGFSRARRRRA